jgi:hypothetical protein
LVRNIIKVDEDAGLPEDERIFRILLFKIFNKIETWKLIDSSVGGVSWKGYSFNTYDRILSNALRRGESIYSAAYIMASGQSRFKYRRKHQNHLRLLEHIVKSGFAEQLRNCDSMAQLYGILLSFPSLGPFLAYQYATDLNYSNLTNFSEEEFVMAGPGARDGIAKCFLDRGSYSFEDIVRFMMENQDREFERLGLRFRSLFGRPLKLIDCQNLFCEVGKYSRVSHPQIRDISGRVRIKQVYKNSGSLPAPSFPQKWNLESNVEHYLECRSSRVGPLDKS